MSNNLDPSAERSFASVYATLAHELFHLVQFSYFAADAAAALPPVDPRGDGGRARDTGRTRASTTSCRRSSCAAGSRLPGGASSRRATAPSCSGAASTPSSPGSCPRSSGGSLRGPSPATASDVVAATYARIAGRPFPPAFHRFAVSVAGRPRRRDRARVPPRSGTTSARPRRAARRPLRPPGAAARRRLLAHRHASRAYAARPRRP